MSRLHTARTFARNLRKSSPNLSRPRRTRGNATAASEEGIPSARTAKPSRVGRTLVPATARALQLRAAPTALDLFIKSWNEFDDT